MPRPVRETRRRRQSLYVRALWCIAVSVAPSLGAQPAAAIGALPPDSVEVRFYRFVATAAKMECFPFQDTIVIGRGLSSSACIGDIGDTSVYLYRDGSGKFMEGARFVRGG